MQRAKLHRIKTCMSKMVLCVIIFHHWQLIMKDLVRVFEILAQQPFEAADVPQVAEVE